MNLDLTKCNCNGARFCEIYKKEMDTAGVNWCKHTSKEKREKYFVNNGGKLNKKNQDPLIKSFRESKKIKNPEDFQFIVKSFMRHHYLLRLVESIRRWYPKAEILVVDDGVEISDEHWEAISKFPGVKFWHTKHDIGLAAGRNLLADLADKKYSINCDDDFIFTSETKIEHLIKIIELKEEKFDIVTGLCRVNGKDITDWHGDFNFKKNEKGLVFSVSPVQCKWKWLNEIPYRKLDLGINFFVAKTETLRKYRHDPQFKIGGEHLDRFITWYYEGLKICQVASCVVGHSREIFPDYDKFRYRRYHDILKSKWNFINMPQHPMTLNPYNASINQELVGIKQLLSRPNIVMLTVGHTGSSVVSAMLGKLGWNLCDADEEFSESVSIRNANIHNKQSKELINNLKEPWLIKDPRFCEKLDLWKPHFEEDTVLLWITKDYSRVAESYKRRGESIEVLNSRIELAEEHYRCWTGPKLKIDYDQIKEAVKLFRID